MSTYRVSKKTYRVEIQKLLNFTTYTKLTGKFHDEGTLGK